MKKQISYYIIDKLSSLGIFLEDNRWLHGYKQKRLKTIKRIGSDLHSCMWFWKWQHSYKYHGEQDWCNPKLEYDFSEIEDDLLLLFRPTSRKKDVKRFILKII